MNTKSIDKGQLFKIDTYNVKQYEGERVVSEVEIATQPPITTKDKYVLAYVKILQANCLIPKSDLLSIDKEVLKITPGEWETIGGDSHNRYIHTNKPNGDLGKKVATVNGENITETKGNAEAICKAINGTYGKGINPDAVEELYKALEGIVNLEYEPGRSRPYIEQILTLAKEALKNAKID